MNPRDLLFPILFSCATAASLGRNSAHATRASNVPVIVSNGANETKLTVDQTQPLPVGQHFQRIGTAALDAEVETIITIQNTDTTAFIILDAVPLVPVK